jgi:hypothetical protein
MNRLVTVANLRSLTGVRQGDRLRKVQCPPLSVLLNMPKGVPA